MLWIWRFIIGYLTIKIDSENSEQVLNKAAAFGINIWNLRYVDGKIYGNVSPRKFIKLRKALRGIKYRIKIIKKSGVSFYIKKHRNRLGIIIGFLSFALIILHFSNFIWVINVEGNNRINTSEIIDSCKKIGIYEGVAKNKIDNKYDSQRLLLIQEGVAWCSLNVEGCVVTVNLSEIADYDSKLSKEPSNLKCDFEGKISKISVSSGNVLVGVGDTVSKGQLLVSGIIENTTGTHFVHSSGEVIASTKRVFSAYGDFEQTKSVETDKKTTRKTLEIFTIKIPLFLGKVNDNHNYICDSFQLKLWNKKVPIKIATEQYKFTQNLKCNYSEEKLVENLYNEIKNQTDEFNFLSLEEQNREVIKNEKGILLKITYICEENIARQDKILLS